MNQSRERERQSKLALRRENAHKRLEQAQNRITTVQKRKDEQRTRMTKSLRSVFPSARAENVEDVFGKNVGHLPAVLVDCLKNCDKRQSTVTEKEITTTYFDLNSADVRPTETLDDHDRRVSPWSETRTDNAFLSI